MKKLELTVLILLLNIEGIMAQSDDAATKIVAMGLAAVVFYGIIALVRGFKAKNKNRDDD